jgi:hypothetical protein
MVARFISLPLAVAKVTAVGKAIARQHQLLNFTEEKTAMHRVYLLGKSTSSFARLDKT